VKVEGGCDVGNHSHEEWEFNEAISGEGTFIIGNKKLPLKPGLSYATPPGISHIVSAPEEDIYLLAKFVPGL
jgi:quercetin dioxygenase-like cupin family protein